MVKVSICCGDSTFRLVPGETVLGRDPSCQLRFSDPQISRRHLSVHVSTDGVLAEDLGSSNGTLINGVSVTGPCHVNDGDLVQLGSTVLRIAIDTAATAVAGQTLERLPDTVLSCDACGLPLPVGEPDCPRCRDGGSEWPMAAITTAVDDDERIALAAQTPRERRRHPRAASHVPVVYDSDTLNVDAEAADLSGGGVFLVTELLDQVGTNCRMIIRLDSGQTFSATGIVRHVAVSGVNGVPGMGIEFIEIEGRERTALEQRVTASLVRRGVSGTLRTH